MESSQLKAAFARCRIRTERFICMDVPPWKRVFGAGKLFVFAGMLFYQSGD